MGQVRIQKYGDEIIEIVREYTDNIGLENTLDEQLPPPKKRKEKGETHKKSLEMFLAGKNIEQITRERDLARSTIVGHLASFIKSGKIKLEDLIEPEKIKKLQKLIRKTPYDSLSDLKAKLGEEYSYEDLRLVLKKMET